MAMVSMAVSMSVIVAMLLQWCKDDGGCGELVEWWN